MGIGKDIHFLERGTKKKNLAEWLKQLLPEFPQLCLLGDKSFMPAGLTEAASGPAVTGFILAARLILRKRPHRPEGREQLKCMMETASFES